MGDNACVRAPASSSDQSRRRPSKASSLGRRRVRPGGNACARTRMHARGRQCMRPCDDGWRVGGVFFHKHPKLQRSCDGVCARARMPASGRQCPHARGRQRVRLGDNVCARATMGAAREGCFFTNTPNFNARATTSASGRQHLRPGDDVRMRAGDNACARATTGAAWEGCFFTNTPNFNAWVTTSTSRRQRLRTGDDVRARATTSGSYCPNVGILFCFGNPNKTFPLSLFENYSNCVEDGNPKLFLLVGVFLSALNRDLAFLSRHLSV